MYGLDINFDYNTTKKYRFIYKDQCDCNYCINYYKTFKMEYPKLSKFLEEFGLDIKFPLEIIPLKYNELENKMEYISYYCIKASINNEKLLLHLEQAEIRVLNSSDIDGLCPNPKMKDPYLIIEISKIKLTWILNDKP